MPQQGAPQGPGAQDISGAGKSESKAVKQAPQAPQAPQTAQAPAAQAAQPPAARAQPPAAQAPAVPAPAAQVPEPTVQAPQTPAAGIPEAAPQQREPLPVSGAAAGNNAPSKDNVSNSEFDFESANAQFKKERGEKDSRLDAIPPAAPSDFYNKKSGFFDNISSEVKDRHEGGRGRSFAAEEREKNVQTFGEGAASSTVGNRRGGRRGGPRRRGRANNKPEWA